jgi:hypothetical protein
MHTPGSGLFAELRAPEVQSGRARAERRASGRRFVLEAASGEFGDCTEQCGDSGPRRCADPRRERGIPAQR